MSAVKKFEPRPKIEVLDVRNVLPPTLNFKIVEFVTDKAALNCSVKDVVDADLLFKFKGDGERRVGGEIGANNSGF